MTICSIERRILALWIPYLTTDRLRRSSTSPFYGLPGNRPLVVVGKQKNALVIVTSDQAALRLGLRQGLALADARARVPDIDVFEHDPRADTALLIQIADWCDRYTPLVGLDAQDGLFLDITGCAHLFGGEEALLSDALFRLSKAGIQARAAIAGTAYAARARAHFGQGGIISAGDESQAVRHLTTAALGIDAAVVKALARAGLKTIADIADRPRAPLTARFGPQLLERLDQTLGRLDTPISPRRIVPICSAHRALNEPLVVFDDVKTILGHLVKELCQCLDDRGEGGRAFELTFFRVDGTARCIDLTTSRPNREDRVLSKLFVEKLEALASPLDAGFGFDLMRLSATRTEPMSMAQQRLDHEYSKGGSISDLIDCLSARLGEASILRFASRDTHVPERSTWLIPALVAPPRLHDWPMPSPNDPPSRPISLFSPPHLIDVIAEVPDGPPLRFKWRRVQHVVVHAEGPERIASEWWRAKKSAKTRDYYRVEDCEGRRFWLFREGIYGREIEAARWFLHGLFA